MFITTTTKKAATVTWCMLFINTIGLKSYFDEQYNQNKQYMCKNMFVIIIKHFKKVCYTLSSFNK